MRYKPFFNYSKQKYDSRNLIFDTHYLMKIFKQKERIFLYQKHVKYKIVLGNVEVYNLKYIQGIRY
jgi:hypothetical protein